jgi:NAD(P)-dependent dehydrogenase (short-subunit alcohol dehydrogenase family)
MRTVRELMSLEGRGALVAGGAGHVGRAAAETLAELGAHVAVCDADPGTEAVASELGAHALTVDLADEAATRAAVRDAAAALGGLDVVVYAAGLVGSSERSGWNAPFAEQTVAAWDDALRVNLTAAFVLTQEAAPLLARSGHGSIVLLSSIYGAVAPDASLYDGTAMANPVAYGVSKGGVTQLARYLAAQLAPDVRVNSLAPGGIERAQPDEFRERYAARTPLRRLAREEDLKGAIAYLASDLSAYVTGHELVVDGGWTVW